jgi:hypothetical protein
VERDDDDESDDNEQILRLNYHAHFSPSHLESARAIGTPHPQSSWVESHLDTPDLDLSKRGLWLRLRTYPSGDRYWALRKMTEHSGHLLIQDYPAVHKIADTLSKHGITFTTATRFNPIATYDVSRCTFTYKSGVVHFDAVRLPGNMNFAVSTFTTVNLQQGPKDANELQLKANGLDYCSKLFGALHYDSKQDSISFPTRFIAPTLQNEEFPWFKDTRPALLSKIQHCVDANLAALPNFAEKLLHGVVTWHDGDTFRDITQKSFTDFVDDVYEHTPSGPDDGFKVVDNNHESKNIVLGWSCA